MMKSVVIGMFIIILVNTNFGFSQTPSDNFSADIAAYCNYITEKNSAKNIQLKSPDTIVRFDNGDVYNNLQQVVVVGLSKDLSDFSKAGLIRQLIKEECQYYQLNQSAKLQIAYAIPAVKAEALRSKLEQINSAKKKLKSHLAKIQQRLDNQNETIRNYYSFDSYLKKLGDAEQEIYIDLASLQIPKIKPAKLNQLLNQLMTARQSRQHILNKLQKQDNWSFQLQAGAQQNLATNNNQNQSIQPYFALFFRYNLGSISSNRLIDKSEEAFIAWQKENIFGTQKKLSNLLTSVVSIKTAEEKRLRYLKQNYHKYDDLAKNIKQLDTPAARQFQRQIEADRILAAIEINYVKQTISLLQRALL